MKSIFNAKNNAEFIARIDKLTASTPALWGKMDVSQMLAHCQILIKLALGDLKLNRVFLGLLFGNIAKKDILKDGPVKKNLPTFKKAKVSEPKNFEEEKAGLLAMLKKLLEVGPAGVGNDPHPFFGHMTPEEWGQLNAKHLDHHLAQFGV